MKKTILICMLGCVLNFYSGHSFGCTTFIISGRHTPDGKPILFKHRDTQSMQNSLVVFNDGIYRYLALVSGNDSWDKSVWGGFNESGFAIMNSAAYNNNVGDTTTFSGQNGVIMKLALQYCQTVEDFENMLDTLPKPLGANANFGVIDAFGGAAFYETGNYAYVKYDANNPFTAPNGVLVRTNHSMSGVKEAGFGYNRYNTATDALDRAYEEGNLNSQYLLNNITRNLYHTLTQTDLSVNLPEHHHQPDFRFFIDYIPRYSTTSSILIQGARNENEIDKTVMWTILGFPLTSVAVPVWLLSDNELPQVVSMDENTLKSPICTASLKLKDECFPLTYDNGRNYINLAVVLNQENTGFMQVLQPVEEEIFKRADQLIDGLDQGSQNESDIRSFYIWVDQHLGEAFTNLFGIQLY